MHLSSHNTCKNICFKVESSNRYTLLVVQLIHPTSIDPAGQIPIIPIINITTAQIPEPKYHKRIEIHPYPANNASSAYTCVVKHPCTCPHSLPTRSQPSSTPVLCSILIAIILMAVDLIHKQISHDISVMSICRAAIACLTCSGARCDICSADWSG